MKKICIALSVVVAVGLILLITSFAVIGADMFDTAFAREDEIRVELPPEDMTSIKNITIDAKASDVKVTQGDDDYLYISYLENEEITYSSSVDGDSYKFTGSKFKFSLKNLFVLPRHYKYKITVVLPRSVHNLSVKTGSGDINITGVLAQALSVNCTSGNITVQDTTSVAPLELKCTSGNVKLNDVTAHSLTVNVTSGNIVISNLSAQDKVDLKSTSGNVKPSSVTAHSLTVKVTSGNIIFSNLSAQEKIDLKSTSGEIGGRNISAAEAYFGARSGNILVDDITAKIIKAECTSGNVRLKIIGNKNDYDIELSTRSGGSRLDGSKFQGSVSSAASDPGSVVAKTTSGFVRVSFI